jgi:hypothetical protein
MRRESRSDLRKQPVGEYLRLATHLPHVNRRAENKGIGMLNCVIKFLHVVVDNTTMIALAVAAQTTSAWFDIKIAAKPGLSFGALLFRTFEYFVYYPGRIAFFPWTCDKSDDFHIFCSLLFWE